MVSESKPVTELEDNVGRYRLEAALLILIPEFPVDHEHYFTAGSSQPAEYAACGGVSTRIA